MVGMHLSRLPAVLIAGVLLGSTVSCATTIEGTGALAADVATGSPTPSAGGDPEPTSSAPEPTADPTTPAPTPTTNPVVVKERLLCVLVRASIASINSQFNKEKERSAQITVLRNGANTVKGHINRAGLPTSDGIRRSAVAVLDQLRRLVTDASGGASPSTAPYNKATQNFQKACSSVS